MKPNTQITATKYTKMNTLKKIGAEFKQRRLDKGLTQIELAALAGVSRDVVIALEAGSRQVYTLNIERINNVLND